MTSLAENRLTILRKRATDSPQDFVRYFDDFVNVPVDDTTGNPTAWTETADAGATAATGPVDTAGGWMQVACDGDDNDESYLSSVGEVFIFNTTDEVVFETRVTHDATTANKGAFVVGLSDVVAADTITNASGIVASFDGAVFLKAEDATSFQFTTSNASSQSSTTGLGEWADGDTVKLGFHYHPNDGVTAKVTPIINGVAAVDSNGDTVIHDLTISGLAEMHILLGVKTHAAEEQTLLVDYVDVVQER